MAGFTTGLKVIIINPRTLSETSDYPTSLVALKGTILLEFVLEEPLSSYQISTRGARH
jgi:hypothetical protein